MKNKNKSESYLKKFLDEIKGYGIKVQLTREDRSISKRFEDLDFEVLFNHITQVLPGTKLSVSGGCEEFFEESEEDESFEEEK